MMGKLQITTQQTSSKMNVSGQVYEEPLTFECGTHISRRGRSDISESHNDTLLFKSHNNKLSALV